MPRTGKANLTRPKCYRRTPAQVIEAWTAYQRLRLRLAIDRVLSRILHVAMVVIVAAISHFTGAKVRSKRTTEVSLRERFERVAKPATKRMRP
jgi:hypothetical protein